MLADVSNVDTSTTVFGRSISFPLSVSPAGVQAMAHPDGELATSRACARKGVNMAISSFSNHSIEAVRSAAAEVGPIDHAIQMYTMRDRELEERIITKAEAAGCKAIFLTADSPVLGVRYNEWKKNFFDCPRDWDFRLSDGIPKKSGPRPTTRNLRCSTMTRTAGRERSRG